MKLNLRFLEKILLVIGLTCVSVNDSKGSSLFPIATRPEVEVAFSVAFDGTNYLVAIAGDQISEVNRYGIITAQLISPTGALVGGRIDIGGIGDIPSVAFDGTNYLLIWKDSAEDIHGQRVSRSGALVGSGFAISAAPGEQKPKSFPPVAFGAGNYLVVWQDGRSGVDSIYGQLVSASGALVGSEIAIDNGLLDAKGGSVGFDGANFLVVWQKRASAPTEKYDTYGMFITPSGIKSAPIMISQTSSARYNPLNVVFDGTNYLVIWNKDIGPGDPSPSDFDIYGRFISPTGSFAGNERGLVTGAGDQSMPGLAFDGANYLLNWDDGPFGSPEECVVRFQFFDAAGQAKGPQFTPFAAPTSKSPLVAASLFDGARFTTIATFVSVDANFDFSSGDIYGLFMPGSSTPPRIDLAGPVASGQVPLLVTGTPGINYVIQFSADIALGNWTGIVTNSPVDGTFSFTDSDADGSRRFYRVISR